MKTGTATYWIFLIGLPAVIFLDSCIVLKNFTDPLRGLAERRSCISVDFPPITLTPERTAAERQLIGENKEIEENGWLIASLQSSLNYRREGGGSTGILLEKIKQLYREKAVLEFFQDDVNEYLNNALLGEGREGRLLRLPGRIITREGKRFSKAEFKKAEETAAEVNKSRRWIHDYFYGEEKKKKNPDLARIRREYLDVYRDRAPRGIWIQNSDGIWLKK